jgi:hypothetical protein
MPIGAIAGELVDPFRDGYIIYQYLGMRAHEAGEQQFSIGSNKLTGAIISMNEDAQK